MEFHSSSENNYAQLKSQTLELWCQQQQKLGNLLPSGGDRYQIMRQDHQLGIDAFVAEAMRLSTNVTPTQALKLLQSCIQIMPKSGGNSRPVGRPSWFLLSASDQYFKRAWANTFDFSPNTGKINSNLPVDALLIAINVGPVIIRFHVSSSIEYHTLSGSYLLLVELLSIFLRNLL